jgi:hypothetical protein
MVERFFRDITTSRLRNGVSRTTPDPAGENHLCSVQAMPQAGRVCVMPFFAAAGA